MSPAPAKHPPIVTERPRATEGHRAVTIKIVARSRTSLSQADFSSSSVLNATPATLHDLNQQIIGCERCLRLRAHCQQIATVRRRAYTTWEYWGKPVPSFGDPNARVMILGLAPGAHGSNRTGRPFTGDGSGNFLYPVLHSTRFASQPRAESREDGMVLRDLWITSVVRCAPPGNKPSTEELANCTPFLDAEIALLRELRVIVCLGKIAFDGLLTHLRRQKIISSRQGFRFEHGAEYKLPDGRFILASYHPSLQNTNTGLLTAPMLRAIFARARKLADLPAVTSNSKRAAPQT